MQYVHISFASCLSLFPNSSGSQIVKAEFRITDAGGLVATAEIVGTKDAVNSLDGVTHLSIDGVSGSNTHTASAGTVSVTQVYPIGFDIENIKSVELHVEDHLGWRSIDAACGFADRIMTEIGEEIRTEADEPLIFT